jgi:hypothetical protein
MIMVNASPAQQHSSYLSLPLQDLGGFRLILRPSPSLRQQTIVPCPPPPAPQGWGTVSFRLLGTLLIGTSPAE